MKKKFSFPMHIASGIAAAAILLSTASCGKKPAVDRPSVSLNTNPAGATVTIRGLERGKTPLKGKMNPGTYLIKFSLPGYKSNWQKIELVPGSNKNLTFEMEPETASVMITSSPDAAAVEFQGRRLGLTPVVVSDLPHGQYTAELTRHGFSRQTAGWTIDSSTPKLVKVSLDSNSGTLMVDSTPENAEVLLNGKTVGRTPFKESVEEGRHTLELRKNGYVSLKKSVQVRRGLTTNLAGLVLGIKSGSIAVSSKPAGAGITINGKPYGDTPVRISNLAPGTYSIKLEKEGFDPAVRTVNLPAGENLDLMLNLDSNTGGIDIVTQPPGLTLYLDGKQVGITEKDSRNKNVSKVFKIRNLSTGKHRLTIAHKRARPEKKYFNFSIEKGKTVRLTGLHLWIPNAVITRHDGTVETGRIIQDLPSKYEFEPSPGVRYTIEKSTVRKIDRLPENE